MVAWLFLAMSLAGAWLTFNVYRPHYASGRLALATLLFCRYLARRDERASVSAAS
jgi:hypothetical protein